MWRDRGSVLVVDDVAANRALAQATLEDEGIRVVLAATGEEAIAAFVHDPPACIVLDIRLPGLDGVTVCERIRALPGGDRVAIVFVTAQRDVETFDRARSAGGDDFLTKPFRPGELVARVGTALHLRQLAAERGELAAQLKQQRDELQRLQLHKEELAAFLVHDLKNPVNAIGLHARRVLRNPSADARSRDAAASIQDETRSLTRMISNLLDLGKADEGQLAPARRVTEARALVNGVLAELAVRASALELRLDFEVRVETIDVDPDLVHRILANLVDNSLSHGPQGSTVRLVVDHGAGALELRVSDAGPGVPEALRAHVFERFMSGPEAAAGDSAVHRAHHGLGLAFCKSAVEAHGGRIWVEDGRPGAVFCVRIPDAR